MRHLGMLIVVLCGLISFSLAQTKTPNKPAKSAPLVRCETERDQWHEWWGTTIDQRNKLEAANRDLEARNDELTKKYEALRTAAKDVLTYTQTLDVEYRKMLGDYGSLLDTYNSMVRQVQEANDRHETEQIRGSQQQMAALARQERIASALAVYRMMPRYTPPITLQVMDCTKLPALCVH